VEEGGMKKGFWVLLGLLLCAPAALAADAGLGIFEGQSDIGSVSPAGTGVYNPTTGNYTVTAAGSNIWARVDNFHFLWKKMSGDLDLTADIAFPKPAYSHAPDIHRKAVLMLRQRLDAGSVYADAALHGGGLTALQYRRKQGANTQDIELNIGVPRTIRLEKRGDEMTLFLSMKGEPLHQVGASIKLHLDGPFYVGLGLSAHDPATTDKVVFSHLTLTPPQAEVAGTPLDHSTLQLIGTEDQLRRSTIIYSATGTFEAPNLMPDGKALLINQDGHFLKIPLLDPLAGGVPVPFDIGEAKGCWGEHGFSPDGKWFAISCSTSDHKGPDVYIVPAAGGTQHQVTHQPVSFFRGWSPDGKTIVFASIRDGQRQLYIIPAAGGTETKLTSEGQNDGAEYTPDGKYIYFDSDRSGLMQLWRMKPDGSDQEQITSDDANNWYPHISPDGKSIVFVSYDKDVVGHAQNKDVRLRIFTPDDGAIRTLVHLTGGQGSIDSPCWIDNDHLAFVSYRSYPDSAP
jgi:hypothetical protein